MIIEARFKVIGMTALQQSKEYVSQHPKKQKETHADFEERTWINRAHVGPRNTVVHPASAFKRAIVEAARYLGTQIPGQGKKTFTQKFQSGMTFLEDLDTGVKLDAVEKRSVFGSSSGKTGQGGRVWKHFPTIAAWRGELVAHIYDEILTKDVVMTHFDAAGKYIGVGTWRPANGGENGRFRVEVTSWKEI